MNDKTIGNPVSWAAQKVAGMGRGVGSAVDGISSHDLARPQINRIGADDIRSALKKGVEDFGALRSDVIFLVVLYPVIGFVLALWSFNTDDLHLLFPLVAGFPLVGPVAALGLYELSRRRERGEDANWSAALDTLTGRILGPVIMLSLLLVAIFTLWMLVAHAIWSATLGPASYDGLWDFLGTTLSTAEGWTMIVVGLAVGFVFAAVTLCISMVSFPMMIDRQVGVPVALATSFAVARRNPGTTALWGLVVAVALMVGMIPLFAGLVVVLPILGHATWHLYRSAVAEPEIASRAAA
ncbi:DUF2189 domain-containing protein [Paracoccus stylophorae]|uniref:DUF2189 domain-containing protein n=1 Tax=Paracoccus stylophorae TaxID=659350 RepID=A0ABY7SXJ1_9RHOB|nr:DUF2189 domain-containing protein [Paracoccus stylophorae]WCR11198.1 DUF2189 domain-containing protein [Paracoccus stylophorae]